jgi:hypothetical protein
MCKTLCVGGDQKNDKYPFIRSQNAGHFGQHPQKSPWVTYGCATLKSDRQFRFPELASIAEKTFCFFQTDQLEISVRKPINFTKATINTAMALMLIGFGGAAFAQQADPS